MSNSTVWEWRLNDKSGAAFDKLNKKFKKTERDVDDIEGKSKKFTGGLKKGLNEAAAEIPGLNRGLNLIKNPLILGAGAALGFGAAMLKGAREARKFNHEFLELKNLNLNKSTAEIDRLKKSILDLSFEQGLNPEKTSKAFFDVQSATGKYGKEVELTVAKVGKFAQIMKADFNGSIEGASKAMGIYGFGAEKMDAFLASQFKTVQVGITTFDQLSKVQTEYAKSAAASNQGFDEANKLFAVFSANEKSVDIAATKTRGAFEDLTKARTIKGFKKLGVEIFDAGGNTKKLDDIVADLVPKLKGMSDTRFSALKEEIGGNEGLRGLLDTLKGSGDKVLETFKAFDGTEFDLDKALANANGDLEIMSNIVDNKLTAAWIKFGEKSTPVLLKLKGLVIDILDGAGKFMDILGTTADQRAGKMDEERATKVKEAERGISGDSALVTYLSKQGKGFDADQFINKYSNNPQNLAAIISKSVFTEEERKALTENTKGSNPFSDDFKKRIESEFDSIEISRMNGMSMTKILELRKDKMLSKDDLTPKGNTTILPTAPGAGGGAGSGGSTPQNLTGISGAAKQVRNVTVNIQNLVRELTVNKEGGALSPEDLSRQLEEILIRAVHDGELALSS